MITRRLTSVAKWAVVVVFLFWTIVPIVLVVANSFKKAKDIFTDVPKVFFEPTLNNYVNAFTKSDFGQYFGNSAIVAACSTLIVITLATFAAYGLTSFRLRFANTIANGFLLGKLVPVIAMLLPTFVIINAVGLRGTLAGPILAHVALNLPFAVWLLMGFFRDVPSELEQAAMIDGCTRMQAFWRVILPVVIPGIAAVFILSAQYSWNELLFSLQLTTLETYTLPVGIASFVGAISVDWGLSSAAATVTMVPMIIIGFFVQKYIAQGTTGGAVKG
ncbi:MAG TPA: carbohydrate ABC transporter permease [Pseudolysinimonas sp.]|jgi:multiple sugar transport system permease protein|nr:carbohydrate ABC transporter permease [Pseudolysinimonas sp.]